MSEKREELLKAIDAKYKAMGQDPDVHLSGLLHAEPMKYWDFIQVDALLGLQTQRTQLPDEMVFIMYHQINELLFKMILWEMGQISHAADIEPANGFVLGNSEKSVVSEYGNLFNVDWVEGQKTGFFIDQH